MNDLLDGKCGEDEYLDDELESIMNFVFGPDSDDNYSMTALYTHICHIFQT